MFEEMLEEVLAVAGGGLPDDPEGVDLADTTAEVWCPYCGEPSLVILDPGGATSQAYVEDCQVCCRPWNVRVRWHGGDAQVEVFTEDEATF